METDLRRGDVATPTARHDLADVRVAYLEPNGMISVVRGDGTEPDTPIGPAT